MSSSRTARLCLLQSVKRQQHEIAFEKLSALFRNFLQLASNTLKLVLEHINQIVAVLLTAVFQPAHNSFSGFSESFQEFQSILAWNGCNARKGDSYPENSPSPPPPAVSTVTSKLSRRFC